ncbi:MAG: geranylgeranylglycerol-phosphate geranylgeranyltransferase [Candidatus Zixiibacteriota bacterium]
MTDLDNQAGDGNRLAAWWRLIRGGNVLLSGGAAIIGVYVAGGRLDFTGLGMVPLAPILITAAGNVQNDLIDRITDSINHPYRPLVSGAISLPTARTVMNVGYIVGLIAAAAVSALALTIAGLVVLGLTLYNLRLSRHPLIGNLTVALLGALPILYGGVSIEGFAATDWILAATVALVAFWLHFARELLKDAADSEGDARAGRRTLPLLFSERLTIRLGAIIMLLAAGFSFLPWYTGRLGVIYLFGICITVVPSLLFGAAQCYGRPDIPIASLWASWLKVVMLAGLVWIVLGVWTAHP